MGYMGHMGLQYMGFNKNRGTYFSRTQKSHGVNVLSNSEIPYCWQAGTQPTLPVQNNGGTQEENSKYLYA